jgi:LPXTG-motif cell wall-anchored protein
MRHEIRWNVRLVLAAAIALIAAPAWAQQTKTTETKTFEIVSVDGNKVVVKDATGSKELTVPPEFRLTVDGKPVTVAELRPGMKGTATITTTTTVKPVFVTEVREGEIVDATGGSILVRTPTGYKVFGPGDMEKRQITIIKDGKPARFEDLRKGDKLAATIVTEGPPQVLTQRQVDAALASPAPLSTITPAPKPAAPPPAASTKPAAPPPPPPAATTKPAPASTPPPAAPAKLPKTASQLPLIGVIGLSAFALGSVLTLRRRLRTAR